MYHTQKKMGHGGMVMVVGKKKKMKGGGMAKKRMMYGHGGEVMPKAKPC